MSPLLSETYWKRRFGWDSPCWSGEKWVDWEHAVVLRSAFRRIWPNRAGRVLDVGCGDGRWSEWLAKTFGVEVWGTDALEFPGVHARIASTTTRFPMGGFTRFEHVDAQELTKNARLQKYRPDVVVFMNSLAYVSDWKQAVAEACHLAPVVIAFDNFQTPVPPWLRNLEHRRSIDQHQLRGAFVSHDMRVDKVVSADWFHRKLFLKTPRWMHPGVAVVSAGLDLVAARVLPPLAARHVAFRFVRRAGLRA